MFIYKRGWHLTCEIGMIDDDARKFDGLRSRRRMRLHLRRSKTTRKRVRSQERESRTPQLRSEKQNREPTLTGMWRLRSGRLAPNESNVHAGSLCEDGRGPRDVNLEQRLRWKKTSAIPMADSACLTYAFTRRTRSVRI